MKRITNRKLRIPITLKLYKNGKVIFQSTFQKKSQVIVSAEAVSWDKAYIKVTYDKIGHNDSDHKNIGSLKVALSAYTEKSQLDFICD